MKHHSHRYLQFIYSTDSANFRCDVGAVQDGTNNWNLIDLSDDKICGIVANKLDPLLVSKYLLHLAACNIASLCQIRQQIPLAGTFEISRIDACCTSETHTQGLTFITTFRSPNTTLVFLLSPGFKRSWSRRRRHRLKHENHVRDYTRSRLDGFVRVKNTRLNLYCLFVASVYAPDDWICRR